MSEGKKGGKLIRACQEGETISAHSEPVADSSLVRQRESKQQSVKGESPLTPNPAQGMEFGGLPWDN